MSARTTIELTREVRDVLVRSTITETSLTLPPGQLERKLYEAVNKVLVAAGGKWNKSAKAHIFQSDPRGLLGLAVELGEITDKKKLLGQYYTPDGLADRMAKLAKLQPDDRLLEPSAGTGALVYAAWRACPKVDVHTLEIDRVSFDELTRRVYPTANTSCGDFLEEVPAGYLFDAVIMNPPFANGQDAQHVEHALQFLKPGGRLVAIMSNAITFRTDGLYKRVRAQLDDLGAKIETLPEGTFKDAGTGVNTVLVSLTMPA